MNLSNQDPLRLTRGKRSLAAVAFTDAVGYSEWANRDESGALSALESDHTLVRDLAEEFGGRVLKSTGDGLMLRFDSAVDAVEWAIAVQDSLAARSSGFQHRIGIHLGDVLVTEDDLLGDGVNIAARLQQVAEPGGICLSQTVHDVVKGRITPLHLRPLGPQHLKNIGEPIVAFAVAKEPVAGRRERVHRQRSAERNMQKTMSVVVGLLVIVVLSQAVLFRYVFSRPEPVAAATEDPRIGWVLPSSRFTELLYLPDVVAEASRLGIQAAPKLEVASQPTAGASQPEGAKPDAKSDPAPPPSAPPITVTEVGEGNFQEPQLTVKVGDLKDLEEAQTEFFKAYDFENFAKWVSTDPEWRSKPEAGRHLVTSLQLNELRRFVVNELPAHGPQEPLVVGPPNKATKVHWNGEALVMVKDGVESQVKLERLPPEDFHDVAKALARSSSRRGDAMKTERWLQVFRREYGIDRRAHVSPPEKPPLPEPSE